MHQMLMDLLFIYFFSSFKILVLTQNLKAPVRSSKGRCTSRKLSVCDRDAALTAKAVVGKRTVGPVSSVWINRNTEDLTRNARAACKRERAQMREISVLFLFISDLRTTGRSKQSLLYFSLIYLLYLSKCF